ncbi:uncharacterized protein V1516DRAFT_683167 [Lipomyces oligophaga]|uniref:uncharacterized protein n=1 Tax=Lipomyces oligophaga TaxID=45792 RepID=UPI0034D0012D
MSEGDSSSRPSRIRLSDEGQVIGELPNVRQNPDVDDLQQVIDLDSMPTHRSTLHSPLQQNYPRPPSQPVSQRINPRYAVHDGTDLRRLIERDRIQNAQPPSFSRRLSRMQRLSEARESAQLPFWSTSPQTAIYQNSNTEPIDVEAAALERAQRARSVGASVSTGMETSERQSRTATVRANGGFGNFRRRHTALVTENGVGQRRAIPVRSETADAGNLFERQPSGVLELFLDARPRAGSSLIPYYFMGQMYHEGLSDPLVSIAFESQTRSRNLQSSIRTPKPPVLAEARSHFTRSLKPGLKVVCAECKSELGSPDSRCPDVNESDSKQTRLTTSTEIFEFGLKQSETEEAVNSGAAKDPSELKKPLGAEKGQDIAVNEQEVIRQKRQKQIFVAKCGHVYCGRCASTHLRYVRPNRRPKRGGTGSGSTRDCVVNGCEQNITGQRGMFQVYT